MYTPLYYIDRLYDRQIAISFWIFLIALPLLLMSSYFLLMFSSATESTAVLYEASSCRHKIIELDQYTLMVKASVPEKDQLFVSLLTPVMVKLDLPEVTGSEQSEGNVRKSGEENQGWIEEFGDLSIRNIVRVSAISAAVGLIGYIIYMRIKKSKSQKKLKNKV